MARVLYIENGHEHGECVIARLCLERAGHEVMEVASEDNGFDRARESHPDCVILNMRSPSMGGVDFLRRWRDSGEDAPVVLVGSALTALTMHECETLGAACCLNRPVGPMKLVQIVEQKIGGSRCAA